MHSLVFLGQPDKFMFQDKGKFVFSQDMDVPISYQLVEVPADVSHYLGVNLTDPEKHAYVKVGLICLDKLL